MKILIVDNELVSREKLRKIMDSFGQCIVVDNGADALQVATSQDPPDLILLDTLMPEMDGYEVCKRLKAERKTSNIPVIFITSKQDEDDEAKGLGLGAVDYIRKPFSPSIVKARVQTHLELEKHRNRLEEIANERTVELKKVTKKMQVEIAERKQAEEALRKTHEELEWGVKERTGELEKKNQQLKVEIEERKQVEEDLQTREKLINALLNNQIDAATVVDKELKMLYVNEFLADRFGRSVDEMIGLSPEDVVDKPDIATAKRVAYFKQVATTGKPVRFEDKRGGIWFDTVVTPVLDKDGQVFQVAILARDITDKKKIEQALVESEKKYRGLVETMAEGLAIQDENGLIIYVNNRFCKMTGYQQDEVIGKKIIDFLDERNKQIVKGEIVRRRKGAPAQPYETEIISA